MKNHYLLWAAGEDRPGIVAGITEVLYKEKANLEDSTMVRLGGEFGVLLIFSSNKNYHPFEVSRMFSPLERKLKLSISVKRLSANQSRFQPLKPASLMISVHGSDKAGIVYHVSTLLKKHQFNITDLITHRTHDKGKAGYILLIEGELTSKPKMAKLKKALGMLQNRLKTTITTTDLSTPIL